MRIRSRSTRSQRGSGLAEGVIGLCMVITGTAIATVLLTDVGMSLYYKQKLGFVANQTAVFAVCLPPGNDDKITEFAQTLMNKLSKNKADCKVKHEIIKMNNKVVSQVTIEADLPLFVSQFEFLPFKTHLQDTAVAVRMFDIWEEIKAQMLGNINRTPTNFQLPSGTNMPELPQMPAEIMQQLQRLRQAQ